MSITYGFFDSNNGDRRYNSKDFSRLFSMVIPKEGGVFDGYSDSTNPFKPTSISGLTITINPGFAWVGETWLYSDTASTITAESADVGFPRYDALVIKSDQNAIARQNSIFIYRGTASSNPTKPDLSPSGNIYYLPIAYIYRPAGSTSITMDNIEYVVGTDECPKITYMPKLIGDWEDKLEEFEEIIESAELMSESRVREICQEEIGSAVTAAINGSY